MHGETSRIAPYSRAPALVKLDGRTREARLIRDTRAELTAHVGGRPSATQRALIDRAAVLTLQVELLDTKRSREGAWTDHDTRTYLAWCNTLTRLLRQLGMKGAVERGPTLKEHLASRTAAA